ncbi:MAG: glycosyltransferase family 2 protein [Bifidobacteriaceae bacterium]|jgi:glycosyltransferase involved in cell wall biosynthesis|nr:glycosyltransferase family 2 protein [Bifidobacteriaceae bacterium]
MAAAEFDDLWCVVPVYNEARVFAAVLDQLTAVFPHVCVVDDASTDGSGRIAAGFAARGVRLVSHPVNLGQGAALQTGFEYALSDPLMRRVVTFDADGQHSAPDAVRLARRLTDGFDVVLGSRFLPQRADNGQADAARPGAAGPGAARSDTAGWSAPGPDATACGSAGPGVAGPGAAGSGAAPAAGAATAGIGTAGVGGLRRFVLKLAVAYTNFSVRLKLTDTHNGLRAMSRRAVAAMDLTQEGMAHATEILERIRRDGLKYTEEPVEIRYSEYSRSKGQSLLNSVNILVDLLVR